MNPSIDALLDAMVLLGESKDDVCRKYQSRRPGSHYTDLLPSKDRHRPPPRSWMGDLDELQIIVWERMFAEILKAQRLEQQHPELLQNPDFLSYRKTVGHALGIAYGLLYFVEGGAVRTYAKPDLAGHRIGTWPEEDAQ